MKIIRHLTPTGPAYAALQPDGSARTITGDLFGSFQLTTQTITPGKRLAPVVPTSILAIGLNYVEHAAEGGRGAPEVPVLFMKSPSSLQNPGDPIELPRHLASGEVDYGICHASVATKIIERDGLDLVPSVTLMDLNPSAP